MSKAMQGHVGGAARWKHWIAALIHRSSGRGVHHSDAERCEAVSKRRTTKIFGADEWIRSLTEAQAITADIPDQHMTHDQSAANQRKVRPIQMGGVRAKISSRLLTLCDGEVALLTPAMRQLGFGSDGGAEALAITHRLIFDEGVSGTPDTPPCSNQI